MWRERIWQTSGKTFHLSRKLLENMAQNINCPGLGSAVGRLLLEACCQA